MAEKAVIIGLFAGLLGSGGLLWANMPPRPEIHYRQVGQTTAPAQEPVGPAPEARVIPIDKPKPVELPAWAQYQPFPQQELKEVMPSDLPSSNINSIPDTRPRQVPLPRRRPVGAVNRPHCICKAVVRRVYVLPQASGGSL